MGGDDFLPNELFDEASGQWFTLEPEDREFCEGAHHVMHEPRHHATALVSMPAAALEQHARLIDARHALHGAAAQAMAGH